MVPPCHRCGCGVGSEQLGHRAAWGGVRYSCVKVYKHVLEVCTALCKPHWRAREVSFPTRCVMWPA